MMVDRRMNLEIARDMMIVALAKLAEAINYTDLNTGEAIDNVHLAETSMDCAIANIRTFQQSATNV